MATNLHAGSARAWVRGREVWTFLKPVRVKVWTASDQDGARSLKSRRREAKPSVATLKASDA